jgi:hypothetical protein
LNKQDFFVATKEMQPTKEDINALKETMIGKIAAEIIADAGGPEAVLTKLQSNDGFGRLFGDVGTKLEAKVRSGTVDENALLREATEMSNTLPNMVNSQTNSKPVVDTQKMFGALSDVMKKYFPTRK